MKILLFLKLHLSDKENKNIFGKGPIAISNILDKQVNGYRRIYYN